jgi:hypothetical protein
MEGRSFEAALNQPWEMVGWVNAEKQAMTG